MREYYVYIMSSRSRTLYTGMTNNLPRRISEHRDGKGSIFTGKCRITRLVYYKSTNDVHVAIEREKQIKKWRREEKVMLIETMNPKWHDLSKDW
jgi:putative endonuclease